jgi:hypothetical protein
MSDYDAERFVVMDATGKEIDWIDPLRSFSESESHWVVSNGLYEYTIKKLPGHTYKIQHLEFVD